MPKVTIIVPVYNAEKYLKQSINSIINQSLQDIEIIFIEDCSEDSSLEILKDYALKDNRINIIQNGTNIGQGLSRNKAIKLASGDYIMFCDPDDWLELDAAETAYEHIYKNGDDFSYFNLKKYYEKTGKSVVDTERLSLFLAKYKNGESFSPLDISTPFMNYGESWYKIYSTSFIKDNKIEFADEKFAEDIPFYIKALVKANKISVISKPLYNYRQRYTSSLHNQNNFKTIFKMRKIAYDTVLNSDRKDCFLNYYLISHIKSILGYYKKIKFNRLSLKKEYYNLLRKEFIRISKNHDIEKIKKYIYYREFLAIIKHNFYMKLLFEFLDNIFSIKNEYYSGSEHKVICIFGIKLKMKCKTEKE